MNPLLAGLAGFGAVCLVGIVVVVVWGRRLFR